MLEIKQFAFGPFGVNTYIIYDTETSDAIVVDPGMNTGNENQRFDKFIADKKLTVTCTSTIALETIMSKINTEH